MLRLAHSLRSFRKNSARRSRFACTADFLLATARSYACRYLLDRRKGSCWRVAHCERRFGTSSVGCRDRGVAPSSCSAALGFNLACMEDLKFGSHIYMLSATDGRGGGRERRDRARDQGPQSGPAGRNSVEALWKSEMHQAPPAIGWIVRLIFGYLPSAEFVTIPSGTHPIGCWIPVICSF